MRLSREDKEGREERNLRPRAPQHLEAEKKRSQQRRLRSGSDVGRKQEERGVLEVKLKVHFKEGVIDRSPVSNVSRRSRKVSEHRERTVGVNTRCIEECS